MSYYVEFCIICIVQLGVVCLCWNLWFIVKMNEDQWMYDTIMSEEVDMNDQNEQECDVNWLFGCIQYFSGNNVLYCEWFNKMNVW